MNERTDMERFVPPKNRQSERGRMFFLLGKRNRQIAQIFKAVKDPLTIIRFHIRLHKIFKKHFPERKMSSRMLDLLMWAKTRNSFFLDDVMKHMGDNWANSDNLLRGLVHRGLVIKLTKTPTLYYLSPDGNLLLDKFSKEVAGLMAEFMRPITLKKPKRSIR